MKVDGEGFMPVFSQGPPFDVGALKGERAGLEKEIPEKIRKTVSRRNGIIVLLRGTSTWEGGGGREGTRLQLGTRRLTRILEQTEGEEEEES